jgi:hypothetical protein
LKKLVNPTILYIPARKKAIFAITIERKSGTTERRDSSRYPVAMRKQVTIQNPASLKSRYVFFKT